MTNYPSNIDDSVSIPPVVDLSTEVKATVVNGIRSAVLAIESAVGTNPASVYGTVANRLNTIETLLLSNAPFTASGDLSGNTENQTVIGLQRIPVSASTPSTNQVLTFNGSEWVAQNQGGSTAFQASGDLSGTNISQNVIAIRGISVSASAPASGQILTAINSTSASWQNAPVSFTAAGDLTGSATSQTVAKIQGVTITGTPSNNYALIASSSSAASWSALPSGFTASGDLSGSSTNQTVIQIHGASVPVAGSLTIGNILQVSGASALSYGALNLAGGSNYVSGVLPAGNQAAQTLTGDVVGTTGSNTLALSGDVSGRSGSTVVGKINGVTISGTPSNGYIISATSSSAASWVAASVGFTAGGDLSGTSTSQTVISIHGATIPAAGSLTAGNILYVSGSSALAYGALNLAGGTSYVTGLLPTSNQASQTMAGDVTGTTAASVVGKLQGIAFTAGTPTKGQFLTATSTSSYGATTISGDITASASTAGALTVAKINGTTIPAGGSLTTGNQLIVTGASALGYAALNLAGGSGYVSGVLPSANQASQTMGGDTSGTTSATTVIALQGNPVQSGTLGVSQDGYVLSWKNSSSQWQALPITSGSVSLAGDVSGAASSNTVNKINGASVPVSGALTTGNILQVSGSSALSYGALNLAGGSAYVTGILPSANQAAQTLSGDVTGTTTSSTVTKIQGISFTSGAPTKGQFVVATSTSTYGATTLSGDITESSSTAGALTVSKINSTTVPAGGSLVTGNGLYVSGISALTYSALNLGGGSGWVTGTLPSGNQASQSMGGDVSGNTASATVAKINGTTVNTAGGSLTTGAVLRVTGASTVDYGAVNLASTSAVTGILPATNQASQSLAGDVTGTTAASTVAKVNGVSISGTPANGYVLIATSSTAAAWTSASTSFVAGGDLSGTATNQTVIALQGNAVKSGTLGVSQDGYVLSWKNSASQWQALPVTTGSITLSGDVSGTSTANTVNKINGSSVPSGGSLTTGNGLYVSGSSALTYSALNLAGGSGYVTGLLPSANQSAQTLTGDVTGTTSANTVAKINGVAVSGTPSDGYILQATTSTAASWIADGGWVPSLLGTNGTLDFSTLSTQTLSTDTTYTIGGLSWTKVNSTNDNTAMVITNGTGLSITPKTGTNYDYNGSGPGFVRTAPLLLLPLISIVPNLTHGTVLEICAYWASDNSSVGSSTTSTVTNCDEAFFGLDTGTAGAFAWKMSFVYNPSSSNFQPCIRWIANGVQASTTFGPTQSTGSFDLSRNLTITDGICMPGGFAATTSTAYSSGTWPDLSFQYRGAIFNSGQTGIASSPLVTGYNLMIGAQCASSGTGFASKTSTLKAIRVRYK